MTVSVEGNRLTTHEGGVPARVFVADMGENGFLNRTDDPAFVSSALAPGETLGVVALGPLRFWDVTENTWIYPFNSDEMIDIVDEDELLATVTGVSGRVDGGAFASADGGGALSARLEFGIRRPCGCLVQFGVFALRLQLTSNVHEASAPFVVLFRYFIDDDTVLDATAGAAALLDVPVCGGDLDLDGQVGLSDLTQLLAHFGLIGAMPLEGDLDGDADVDLSDLTAFLASFGTICTP